MSFLLFSGSSHPDLAEKIAKHCKVPLAGIDRKKFSCGEHYVRFEETVRGQEIFLVQTGRTTYMNEDIMELLLMIDAAKQSFAKKIHVVIPYFPYSRQDKIHEAREGISARLIAKLLHQAGAHHVITIHLHSDQTQGFFHGPVDNLKPRHLFVDYLKKKNIKDGVIVSPDAGGAKMAKKFANDLGMPMAIMHKQRPDHNVAEVTHVIGDVKDKTPIIVDDMVDTGGSMVATKNALIQNGSNPEVYLATTHAIFSGPAIDRLNQADFAEIITTDSLPVDTPPKNFHQLTVADLLGDVILRVAKGESVSGLHLG